MREKKLKREKGRKSKIKKKETINVRCRHTKLRKAENPMICNIKGGFVHRGLPWSIWNNITKYTTTKCFINRHALLTALEAGKPSSKALADLWEQTGEGSLLQNQCLFAGLPHNGKEDRFPGVPFIQLIPLTKMEFSGFRHHQSASLRCTGLEISTYDHRKGQKHWGHTKFMLG